MSFREMFQPQCCGVFLPLCVFICVCSCKGLDNVCLTNSSGLVGKFMQCVRVCG